MAQQEMSEDETTLREQLDALRALSGGVAHEIRNPLAVIQSLVQLLASKTENASQKELARSILTEVQRLNQLLSEFLQFSSPPELNRASLSVETLINKALTFAISPDQLERLEIKIDIPPDRPSVTVDPDLFHQVLLNVIGNAVQSMKGIGILEIRVEVSDRHFGIQIKDTGIGISSENMEKIFLPFFTTRRGGTGLGLAISHQIIIRHGGTLYFKENKDQGMTLFIEVPQHATRTE